MSDMTQSDRWLTLATLLVAGWLIYLLAPVLTPFAVAALLAYLGDPLVDWLETRGLNRTWSVIVVFTGIVMVVVLVLVIVIPMLGDQLARLAERLPVFVQWATEKLRPLLERVMGESEDMLEPGRWVTMLTDHLAQAGNVAGVLLGSISKSGMALIGWVMNLVLIPVVTFYLLRDWDSLVEHIHDLLPRKLEPTAVRLTKESDAVLGAFLRGQLTVMLALGVIYATGLWLVGVEFSLLIGMVAGLISFVPYLGAIVGVGAGLLAALFQGGDWMMLVFVLVVFGIGQMLEGMVLTPLLVGDKIGLHPVAVIFAILAGGQLFGFLGILLALPLASVVMVLLRHAHELYKGSRIYGQPLAVGAHGDAGEVPLDHGESGAAGEHSEAEAEEPPPDSDDEHP